MADSCYFDFVYEPITDFRKIIFDKLISKVSGQKILDLGCGQVGHYWLLGYIQNIDSVDFVDINTTNVDVTNDLLTKIDPIFLQNNFADTIDFLKSQNLILAKTSYQELAEEFVSKINDVEVFDFLSDNLETKYDTIIAIESLECVNNSNDFVLGLNKVADSLTPNGKLQALILRHDLANDYVQKLITQKMEGVLNPSVEELILYFSKSNLKLESIQKILVPELTNYPEAIFLEASLR